MDLVRDMGSPLFPRVVLRSRRDASLRRFHPWVFSGAVARIEGDPTPGDRVSVYDSEGEYLGFGHYSAGSIAVKILSFGARAQDEELFLDAFRNAEALRRIIGISGANDTTAYRLINGEGDFLPGLIVDRYNDVFVIDSQSPGMCREEELIRKAIVTLFGEGVRILVRHGGGESEKLRRSDGEKWRETIRESGLLFIVDLLRGQKTGFFLDQRENRLLVRRYAWGRRVLDAFSYTGAFSVAALAGGALSVESVDISKPALALLKENIDLNFPGGVSTVVRADCFGYLENLKARFDCVILDPPAFAKHRNAVERGLRGYETINAYAFRAIEPGGLIFTFSCSQLIDRQTFRTTVLRAAARTGRRVRVLHELSQAPDHPVNLSHPEGEYLKGFVLEVQ